MPLSIQAVLFDKQRFSTDQARLWLRQNHVVPLKRVHITENLLRYRIVEPNLFTAGSFRLIDVGGPGTGVRAVVGSMRR